VGAHPAASELVEAAPWPQFMRRLP
jgi:hypothetical protein